VLSIVLLAVWLVIGSVMGYSNDNWWLIIGTYTGLVRCPATCLNQCSFIRKSSNVQTDMIDTLLTFLSVHRWSSSVVITRAAWLGPCFSTCTHCCCVSLQRCALSVGAGASVDSAGALVDKTGAQSCSCHCSVRWYCTHCEG